MRKKAADSEYKSPHILSPTMSDFGCEGHPGQMHQIKMKIYIYSVCLLCLPAILCVVISACANEALESIHQTFDVSINNNEYSINSIAISSDTCSFHPRKAVFDTSGNLYLGIDYWGSLDILRGDQIVSINTNDTLQSMIIKIPDNQQPQVILTWNCETNSGFRELILDSDNNKYVAGFFTSEVRFETISETLTLECDGIYSSFILKLNASDEIEWVQSFNGKVRAMNIVSGQKVLFAGSYVSDLIINGTLIGSGNKLNPRGFFGAFDLDGNYLWVNSINEANLQPNANNGLEDNVWISDIESAPNGNIYIGGSFGTRSRPLMLDPAKTPESQISSSGSSKDIFVGLFNSNGDYINHLLIQSEGDHTQTNRVVQLVSTDDSLTISGSCWDALSVLTHENSLNIESTSAQSEIILFTDTELGYLDHILVNTPDLDNLKDEFVGLLYNNTTDVTSIYGNFGSEPRRFTHNSESIETETGATNNVFISAINEEYMISEIVQLSGPEKFILVEAFVDNQGRNYYLGEFKGDIYFENTKIASSNSNKRSIIIFTF